jgi:putative FmdB family regulatory protein
MPLFEYECKKCGKRFEKLVFSNDKDKISCPNCGSEDTKKLLSFFASKTGCSAPSGSGFS